MPPLRVTRNILQLFAIMLRDPTGQHYALELSREARVNVGSIYAILARLEQNGIVTAKFEDIDPVEVGRPPRRYYSFTAEGRRFAQSEISTLQTAFSGGILAHV